MKKNVSTLLAVMIIISQLYCQDFTQLTLPRGLEMAGDRAEMQVYRDHLYMILQEKDDSFMQYLYRYNGGSFTRIALPAGYSPAFAQQFEVLNDKLYMILESDSWYELFSYDGVFTRVEIPYPALKINYLDHMIVYQDQLYLGFIDSSTPQNFYWVRFDGESSFVLIPLSETISPETQADKQVYDGKIFTIAHSPETNSYPFVSYDGTSFEVHPLPDGEHFIPYLAGDMEVYNNNLYIPYSQRDADYNTVDEGLLKFNGTTFTFINSLPPNLKPTSHGMQTFNGKLFLNLHNNDSADFEWHSFDETLFQAIPLPPGALSGGVFDPCVYQCNLYGHFNTEGMGNMLYTYGPTAGCEVFAIPARFRNYDLIDLRVHGRERPWCWTGIDIDWIITPVCATPPCPIEPFYVTLSDKKGKLVWSKWFSEPFSAKFPNGGRPLQLSVGIENDKKPEKVIEIDGNLVANGIEEVRMEIKPNEEHFYLSVKTSKGKEVPFRMTLVNSAGKSVWDEKFMAPFNKPIKPYASESGAMLQISAVAINSLEGKGISEVKYYPNPVYQKLTLELKTKGEDIPFLVTVTDLKGNKVFQKTLVAPLQYVLDFTNLPAGLYTLTFKVDDVIQQELIEVK